MPDGCVGQFALVTEDRTKIAGTVNDADNFHCTFVDTVKDNVAL